MIRPSTFLASSFLGVLVHSNQGFAQSSEQEAAREDSSPQEGATGERMPAPKPEGIPLKQRTPATQSDEHPRDRPQQVPRPAQDDESATQEPSNSRRNDEADEADEGDEDAETDETDETDEESPQFAYFGIGPTMLGMSSYDEYGVALAVGGRFPFHDRMAVNAGLTWGLTSFWRTERWWEDARQVGSWTTRAYGNVTRWAGEGEDDEAFRYMAAFYAYIGLLFPYFLSGIMYVAGPLAATSYIDFHMEASFHLFETRKGPYVAAGLGTIAFVDPIYRELKGGIGPSFGAGFDFGWFGVEARGFVSPRHLHGEATAQRTDVYTGSFLLRVQGK